MISATVTAYAIQMRNPMDALGVWIDISLIGAIIYAVYYLIKRG
jgi:hypothetical protein